MSNQTITVSVTLKAPVEKVWEYWNNPGHIVRWAFAQDDWEAPAAENDVRVGGKFKTVMAAKDKSAQFDFTGTYIEVERLKKIAYAMDDGRKVSVEFAQTPEGVTLTETFDPESTHTLEQQRQGWQAILNNFKLHVEAD